MVNLRTLYDGLKNLEISNPTLQEIQMYINPVNFFKTSLIPAACFLFTIILPVSETCALSNDEYDKLRVYSDVLSIIQTNYVDEKNSLSSPLYILSATFEGLSSSI